jgi:hypothetical protein
MYNGVTFRTGLEIVSLLLQALRFLGQPILK